MDTHPCGICGVHVLESDEAIQCDGKCSLWHHRECLGMTLAVYINLSKGHEDWVCRKCIELKKIKQEVENSQRRRQISPEVMGKTKVECKKLDSLDRTQKCTFCHSSEIDEIKYGPIYAHKNIITHYFCLLLSSNMEQNGRDSDGILGFLPDDIIKEVKRGVRLVCTFCRTGGATLGCSVSRCKVVFHLPCGLQNGTLHQFFSEFKSYCAKHRPVQKISEEILAAAGKGVVCGICYDKVVPRPINETLWAPCCKKSAFFHRECVQKLAISAGYFFKCPLCNDKEIFTEAMKQYGIYIPEQDASWESVPNAFQDLLVRHDSCDSTKCICPSGRKTNVAGTRWELILCKFCGSQGIHIGCGRLKWKSPEFQCNICTSAEGGAESPLNRSGNTRNYNGNRHRLSGGRTPEIHSFSSLHENHSSTDSDDSSQMTVTNRRMKVKSPLPESRPETPPAISRPRSKTKHDISERKVSSLHSEDSDQEQDFPIVIDDSDSDIELVSETRLNNSLKTNEGTTIEVVQINSDKVVQKRPRVVGDVKVLSAEVLDVNSQILKKKAVSPPKIKEVVFNFPTQKKSSLSTTTYSVPSTSFAPPQDISSYILVDPSTFRPGDCPPGNVLYRSVQPVTSSVPPTLMQPQAQQQTLQSPHPTAIPMQQLGSTSYADAQYTDFSEYRTWSSDDYSALLLTDDSEEIIPRSLKHRSARRRVRPRRLKCDRNRLNPRVNLSPLKWKISSKGYVEIIIPQCSSFKKIVPQPTAVISSKSSKTISTSNKIKKRKVIKMKFSNKINLIGDKLKIKQNDEIIKMSENTSQNSKLEVIKKVSIEDYFSSFASAKIDLRLYDKGDKSRKLKLASVIKGGSNPKKAKTSTSPTTINSKKKEPLESWKYKKIDCFFKKDLKSNSESQPECSENNQNINNTSSEEVMKNIDQKHDAIIKSAEDTLEKIQLNKEQTLADIGVICEPDPNKLEEDKLLSCEPQTSNGPEDEICDAIMQPPLDMLDKEQNRSADTFHMIDYDSGSNILKDSSSNTKLNTFSCPTDFICKTATDEGTLNSDKGIDSLSNSELTSLNSPNCNEAKTTATDERTLNAVKGIDSLSNSELTSLNCPNFNEAKTTLDESKNTCDLLSYKLNSLTCSKGLFCDEAKEETNVIEMSLSNDIDDNNLTLKEKLTVDKNNAMIKGPSDDQVKNELNVSIENKHKYKASNNGNRISMFPKIKLNSRSSKKIKNKIILKKACKKSVGGIINKTSRMSHYFNCDNDRYNYKETSHSFQPADNILTKESDDQICQLKFDSSSINSSILDQTTNVNSPTKRPLLELQYNIISNFC